MQHGPDSRVFVVEKLVTDTDHRTEMDLRVLAWFGGRERGVAELPGLAAAAGLRVAARRPYPAWVLPRQPAEHEHGRLTEAMLDAVFLRARELLEGSG